MSKSKGSPKSIGFAALQKVLKNLLSETEQKLIERMDSGFRTLDNKIETVRQNLEDKLDGLNAKKADKTDVEDLARHIEGLFERHSNSHQKITNKLENHEERLAKLETV